MQRLNYSREAIPQLIRGAKNMKDQGYPQAALMIKAMAEHLSEAVKFMMPQGGVFDGRSIQDSDFDLFRLPYDKIAIEFRAVNSSIDKNPKDLYNVQLVPRRIALALDASVMYRILPQPWVSALPEGVFIFPINGHESGAWIPSYVAVFQPYYDKTAPPVITPEIRAAAKEMAKGIEWLSTDLIAGFQGRKIIPIGELFDHAIEHMQSIGMETGAAIVRDVSDECCAVIEMCVALNLANVHVKDLPANRAMNAILKRKGKPLRDDYKVLVVDTPSKEYARLDKGTHASPRFHIRRGHIRRLHDGRRVWVRATSVGDPAGAKIFKDYGVRH